MRTAIGVDVGGTSVRAARVTAAGEILKHETRPTPSTPAAALALIDAMIVHLAGPGDAAVGVGVPSRVNAATGRIASGGYVDLSGGPLRERLQSMPGLPVHADNDANMALIAEAKIGAGAGVSNLVLLTLGTGIGGAIRLGDAMVRGSGIAGQLGHLTVDINGARCACGRSGCLETTSSGTALRRFIAEAGLPASTTCEDLIARDDPLSRSVLARWAGPLREGIDSLVAALDPELVLLGGGLGAAACRALERFPPRSTWFQCRIAPAALGERAGVVGAALAALEAAQ